MNARLNKEWSNFNSCDYAAIASLLMLAVILIATYTTLKAFGV